MPRVHESIDVNAPIDAVYEAWSNFENFPEFMSHVKDVRMSGANESVWITRILGIREEWRARTTIQERPRKIAWEATGDVGMSGTVSFTQVEPSRTRVEVDIEWHGGGVTEKAGEALGLDEATVKQDLRNFQQFVEGRKVPRAGATVGGRTR